MKLKNAIVFGILSISTVGSILSAHAEDVLDTVKSRGVLMVGMEGTYPPFNYRDQSGELQGFDVDVARGVAAKLGVKPQFFTSEWSSLIGGLQAGKFDVVTNQVSITPQRRQSLDFTPPYAYSAVQVLERRDDKQEYRSLDELKGKRVAVTLGSNYADYAKSVPGIIVQTYPGMSEALSDLVSGRADAYLNDRLFVPYLIKTSKVAVRGGGLMKNTDVQIGIPYRKGNPKFAAAVNGAVSAMEQDGTLAAISKKWFGTDVTHPTGN
ncbi:cysteine ABC transporter substrate-binding protein [Burkholderia sp. A9]|uniref:transporter substrate-binding domain-containing protein n=1 Tax=Burkholderia sp. A9 TaxID=1365108 RepID=UPI0005749A06|nr:transporter substrate-binding domain-containing protein [Burkholderia sp. A9]KHK59968.1 cysteine ABC transporter substrate-binding protein [Burkholderia sp. A9]